MLIWPRATALVSGTILLFLLAYTGFQRREVRA